MVQQQCRLCAPEIETPLLTLPLLKALLVAHDCVAALRRCRIAVAAIMQSSAVSWLPRQRI